MYVYTHVHVDCSSSFLIICLKLTSRESFIHRLLSTRILPSSSVNIEMDLFIDVTDTTQTKNIEPWSVHKTPWFMHNIAFFYFILPQDASFVKVCME